MKKSDANRIIKYLLYSLFLAGLAVIFYFWITQSLTSPFFLALGRICGLLAVYLVLTQLLLIGRIAWIERVIGHDKLSRIHHANGLFAWVFIIAHPIFITLAYSSISNSTFLQQIGTFITSYDEVLKAFVAFCIFMISIFLSVNLIRRKMRYEYWFLVHLFIYAAIILAFFHQIELGRDLSNNIFAGFWWTIYIFSFGNLILFRFMLPTYNTYTQNYKVDKVVKESPDVSSIYIKANNLKDLNIKPGQFMLFRFISKPFLLESHPYSLSQVKGNTLRITAKAIGDFSKNIANVKPGTKVLIDGPLGRFTSEVANTNKFLLIAGGIGITPIRALFEELSSQKKEVSLIYSASKKNELVLKLELDALAEKSKAKIVYNTTKEGSDPKRIDLDFIRNAVPDFKTRDIYICGPSRMITSLAQSLEQSGVPRSNIHYELFSLG